MLNARLPSGWRETTLGELGSFFRGRGGTRADEEPNGLPCIRYGDLYTHHDCIVRSFASSISPASTSSYTRLQQGDVVFSGSGETFEEIGKAAAYCGEAPAYAGADTIIFRPGPDMIPHFAGYAVNSESANAHKSRMGQGSSVIHIGSDHLSRMPFKFPPCEQQQRIAEILSTVDEAIEQTEALIAKTQQIKAGLMHDLFTRGVTADGQLRPPREEAPQLYKESPLGWIPKEWEHGRLERWLVEPPKNGYSPREVDHWTGQLMLGLGCLTLDGFSPRQLKDAPAGDPKIAGALLAEGDVLISRANTRELVGLVGMFREIGHPCSYPDLMVRLRPTIEMDARFLELSLRTPLVRRQIQANAVGTSSSMVKISGLIVRRLELALPDKAEQQRIVDMEAALQRRLESEQQSVTKLVVLKAGLMQDILTGRVRMPTGQPKEVTT